MTQLTTAALERRIDCALGRTPCELHLKNVRLFNVFSKRFIDNADIFIDDGTVIDAGTQTKASALQVVDMQGATVVPGFIDAHVHIESSMLTPAGFARLVAPHGTTTVVTDPHEIANVCGMDGIRFMIDEAKKAEISVYFMLPSCVPSTPFETAGAVLGAKELAQFMDEKGVLGLAEVMNVPGVMAKDGDLLAKIALAHSAHKRIDGHAPLCSPESLSAYAACGVSSEHEASTPEEAVRLVERGMTVFLREGSAARNIARLAPAVTASNCGSFALCTDDSSPDDVYRRGHINNAVRRAVACGIAPEDALVMASLTAARHYGLTTKGAIAPGFDADFAVIDNLTDFNVLEVWKAGRRIAEGGKMTTPAPERCSSRLATNSVNFAPLESEALELKAPSGRARVIGLVENEILTKELTLPVKTDAAGCVNVKDNPGLIKIAVIERHHASGNSAVGLMRGYVEAGKQFGGAVALTVAHDSHNIIAAGDSDKDMLAAIAAVKDNSGGIALVKDGRVCAQLPLEVAGLMTAADPVETAQKKAEIVRLLHDEFHVPADIHPVMTLSFLALPVIPALRLTDRGIFDVSRFCFTSFDAQS